MRGFNPERRIMHDGVDRNHTDDGKTSNKSNGPKYKRVYHNGRVYTVAKRGVKYDEDDLPDEIVDNDDDDGINNLPDEIVESSIDLKLSIYESEAAGVITESQRNELLEIISGKRKPSAFNSFDSAFKSGKNFVKVKNGKHTITLSFRDSVKSKFELADAKKIYNKIVSSEKSILNNILKQAKAENGYVDEDRESYIDMVEFYLNDKDELDAAAYGENTGQYYMYDIVSKGIGSNVDYND